MRLFAEADDIHTDTPKGAKPTDIAKQAPTLPAIDLVQAGRDLVRPDGTVIYVTKRTGSSIEGIQVVKTGASKITITADTGMLQAESDPNKVRLVLHHAKIEVTHLGGGVATMIDEKLSMVF